jgi:uncharacterized protein YggU (UPF0235/DUF167 family)
MYVRVRVSTGQKTESIKKVTGKDNEFIVKVREKAERGAANKKVLQLVQDEFNNPVGGVRIVNGQHHPIKLLRVGEN